MAPCKNDGKVKARDVFHPDDQDRNMDFFETKLSLKSFCFVAGIGRETMQTDKLLFRLNEYLNDIRGLLYDASLAEDELAGELSVHEQAVDHVLEALAAIAHSAFSSQWTHKEFVKKHRVLFSKAAIQPDKIRKSFETLLSSIQPNPTKFWIGHTMLFLKEDTMQRLEVRLSTKLEQRRRKEQQRSPAAEATFKAAPLVQLVEAESLFDEYQREVDEREDERRRIWKLAEEERQEEQRIEEERKEEAIKEKLREEHRLQMATAVKQQDIQSQRIIELEQRVLDLHKEHRNLLESRQEEARVRVILERKILQHKQDVADAERRRIGLIARFQQDSKDAEGRYVELVAQHKLETSDAESRRLELVVQHMLETSDAESRHLDLVAKLKEATEDADTRVNAAEKRHADALADRLREMESSMVSEVRLSLETKTQCSVDFSIFGRDPLKTTIQDRGKVGPLIEAYETKYAATRLPQEDDFARRAVTRKSSQMSSGGLW